MKRLIIMLLYITVTKIVIAVPALKVYKKILQKDGSSLNVRLQGDEFFHYFVTDDGIPIIEDSDRGYCYARIEGEQLVSTGVIAHDKKQRTSVEASVLASGHDVSRLRKSVMRSRGRRKTVVRKNNSAKYAGAYKAPVILAYFYDKRFSCDSASIVDHYTRMLNDDNFREHGAPGSVHTYFSDMSRGQFDLTFDVIGPVRVKQSATYYGGPSVLYGGTDHIGEFIQDAVISAEESCDIDWSQYDWDGDGEVDQVYVLYAGYGRATGGPVGTLWPCAWSLDDAAEYDDGNGGLLFDNVYINRFACSNELYDDNGTTFMGHGIFCHEFSHCLGLPDMYDTNYGGTPAMGEWDLMASGNYNGEDRLGWCPAGWTSYERAFVGWLDIEELEPNDSIFSMKSLEEDGGRAFVIYNDDFKDEYFLLENHKHLKWDKYTPEKGLLVLHVDYDSTLFANNIVNTVGKFNEDNGYDGNFENKHARMVPLSRVRSISNETYYYTFPIESNRFVIDSLTAYSRPSMSLYNGAFGEETKINKPIYDISKDEEGNISFVYMPPVGQIADITGITQKENGRKAAARVYNAFGHLIGEAEDYGALMSESGLYLVSEEGKPVRKIFRR